MNSNKLLTPIFAVTLLALLAGCSSFSVFEAKKIDYKSAGTLPTLEVPPDLTVPGADNRYIVPDLAKQGSATLSEYNKDRLSKPQGTGAPEILPAPDKVRIERAGTQRWLVVNSSPEQAWPLIKEFWQELGFIVTIEQPETGIMETDWAENRAKIPQDAIRSVLGKVLDSLYSTAERDKFRTRLELAKEKGVTEIYISHRGMSEVVKGGDNQTVWQPRPADPELEAEMLRRLMVRFGVEETRAATMVAATKQQRAKIEPGADGASGLVLNDPFDRAWRTVGLALDRIGFTVEDRDRSKGLYFVRYVDPEADAKKDDKGFLSKLFRSDSVKEKPAQYRIEVAAKGDGSQVRVLNQDSTTAKPETGSKIISLLYEQLK